MPGAAIRCVGAEPPFILAGAAVAEARACVWAVLPELRGTSGPGAGRAGGFEAAVAEMHRLSSPSLQLK